MGRRAPLRVLAAGLLASAVAAGEPLPVPPAATALGPLITGRILHANTLEFPPLGLAFRDVVAVPEMKPAEPAADGKPRLTLVFTKAQAAGYGGNVTGWFAVDFDRDTWSVLGYSGWFEAKGIDLATLVRHYGGTSDSLMGTLNGWTEFRFPAGHPELLTGRGDIEIKQGSLLPLPYLTNLLFGDPNQSQGKDEASMRFELKNSRIVLLAARINAPSAVVDLSGHVDFDLNLHLTARSKPAGGVFNEIPAIRTIFAPIFRPLVNGLATHLVRGRLSKPEFILDPFGG